MPPALVIARRELRSFLTRGWGLALLGLFFATWGFYFFNLLGRFAFLVSNAAGMELDPSIQIPSLQESVLAPYFQLILVSYVVLIPVLAMRSLAEERQVGTFELLVTLPVRLPSLVLGKFLALVGMLALFVALAALYPLSLFLHGSPDGGVILGGVLGLGLSGTALAAVSLACGARARSQLVATVSASLVLGLLLLVHTPATLLVGPARRLLELAAPLPQFGVLARGTLSLPGVTYFVLLSCFGLALVRRSLTLERESAESPVGPGSPRVVANRPLVLAGGVALIAAVLLGLAGAAELAGLHALVGALALGLVGLRALRESRRSRGWGSFVLASLLGLAVFAATVRNGARVDLSEARGVALSAHSRAVLERLEAPLEIGYALEGEVAIDGRIERMVAEYVAARPELVSMRRLELPPGPSRSPLAGVRPGGAGKVTYGEGSTARSVSVWEMSEASLTGAILAVTDPHPAKIYVLEPSGAARLSDSSSVGLGKLGFWLARENLAVQALPATTKEVPADAALVLLAGARGSVSGELLATLGQYVERGGRLFLALEPNSAESFQEWLRGFGVETTPAVVVDREQVVFSGGRAGIQPLVHGLAAHPITERLALSRALVMTAVAPCAAVPSGARGYVGKELCFASPGSALERRVEEVLSGALGFESPPEGPRPEGLVPLAVAVTRGERVPAMVVVGDGDWLLNGALDFYCNRDFALNSIHWLLGNDWALAPRVNNVVDGGVAISSEDMTFLMALAILLAEALVLAGAWQIVKRH